MLHVTEYYAKPPKSLKVIETGTIWKFQYGFYIRIL